jgi:hypothetical protein
MTFKWIINRPAFQANVQGVEVMHAGISTEFETGSVEEAAGIFTDSGTALAALFGSSILSGASGLALAIGGAGEETSGDTGGSTETSTAPPGETEAQRKKREKKEKAAKNQPDPSTATRRTR